MTQESIFKQKVIEIVRMVPSGRVVSYGQVALYAGLPRAAREVGWVLNGTEGKVYLPWWRVLNNKGYISIAGTKFHDKMLQKKLLEGEGIVIKDDFTLDIEKYRFVFSSDKLKKLQLPEEYIQKVIKKYGI